MDGNRHRGGEDYTDFDVQRNSNSDDSVSNLHHHFDNHRRNPSGDNQHHQRYNRSYLPCSNSNFIESPRTWEETNYNQSLPLAGRKRYFSHSAQGTSSDYTHTGSIVKLYVGDIPRLATENDIRSVFGEYGNVVEVVLVKDKWSGQQQEWCFVKYTAEEEAQRAIRALDGRYTFFGGACPVKVRYADKERERTDLTMRKLYVGSMSKQASESDVLEIFSNYGVVEDIYIVQDERKQQRGCAFVQFSNREMAISAINALHGTYIMRGCEQPLIVRFAEPKKPRGRDSRVDPHIADRMVGHVVPGEYLPVSL